MSDQVQKVTPYASPTKVSTFGHYRKALVAVLGVALTGLNVLYGTNPYVQLLIGTATALGVYAVPNAIKI